MPLIAYDRLGMAMEMILSCQVALLLATHHDRCLLFGL